MMELEKLRKKAAELPLSPGVYIMHDKTGKIIYVGKARHLRNRVSQYFHDLASHTPKVLKMVENVDDFEVIVADSEFDALVLENILIKKHLPKYNIKLKDDKGYPFIRLDPREDFPRFNLVSKRENDGARYFGPYGSRGMAHNVIATISETLRLPTCSRVFPRDIGRDRPCLNAQMNRCIAPCKGTITKEDYQALIRQSEMMLRGEYADLLAAIGEEMGEASENLDFERAAVLRDRLYAVRRLGSKQIIINDTIRDADAVATYTDDTGFAVVLLTLRAGSVVGKFTVFSSDAAVSSSRELMTDFMLQYYSSAEDIPGYIFLSDETEDMELLEKLIGERAGRRVHLLLPKRGEKHAIVDMAIANARDELVRAAGSEQHKTKTAASLASLLALPAPPSRIEAFDISNTGDAFIVASMVVFENGKPRKSDYRKFRIKSTASQDDFASIHEVISRRIADLKEGKTGFEKRPDLLLIDGGPGQLGMALDAMQAQGEYIPCFGMQKDDRHRTAALVTPDGSEIGLTAIPAVFSFIGTIQEEAHRFAIGYHRTLRDKKPIKTELEDIPGIGVTRRTELLKKFRSVAGIRRASLPDLAAVIGHSAAVKVYTYFHPKESEGKENPPS